MIRAQNGQTQVAVQQQQYLPHFSFTLIEGSDNTELY